MQTIFGLFFMEILRKRVMIKTFTTVKTIFFDFFSLRNLAM
jgi:hypothetical protein